MFHPLYEKNPEKMKNIHKQFIEELRKSVQVCVIPTRHTCYLKVKCCLLIILLIFVLVELCSYLQKCPVFKF